MFPLLAVSFCFEVFHKAEKKEKVRSETSFHSLPPAVVVEVGCKPREIFSGVLGAADRGSVSQALRSIWSLRTRGLKLTPEQLVRAASITARAEMRCRNILILAQSNELHAH